MEIHKQHASDRASDLEGSSGVARIARRTGLPLTNLEAGQRALILGIDRESDMAVRLTELGLCPGTSIERERSAPLGDPIVFRFRGASIALRGSEARWIQVEVMSGRGGDRG